MCWCQLGYSCLVVSFPLYAYIDVLCNYIYINIIYDSLLSYTYILWNTSTKVEWLNNQPSFTIQHPASTPPVPQLPSRDPLGPQGLSHAPQQSASDSPQESCCWWLWDNASGMLRGNLMGIEKRTETSWMCLKMESSPISGDVYENMMIVGEIGLDHKFAQGQPWIHESFYPSTLLPPSTSSTLKKGLHFTGQTVSRPRSSGNCCRLKLPQLVCDSWEFQGEWGSPKDGSAMEHGRNFIKTTMQWCVRLAKTCPKYSGFASEYLMLKPTLYPIDRYRNII